jgi:FAD/FMN-containing dehydrogenase
MVAVGAWGRLGRWEHQIQPLFDRRQVAALLPGARPGIAHGMGRSYGDVCLNPGGHLWLTRGLDRFLDLDPDTGQLVCEAGVLLGDIQRLAIPRGWMLPVTPGTQLATLGGAIANDVHGKNHHGAGSFGDHVRRIELVRSDGEGIECGPDMKAEWFRATVGGLGLTGLITLAEIQLRPVASPWLLAETLPFRTLDEFFQLAQDSEPDWEYSVAWIDCLAAAGGRGLFLRARGADAAFGTVPRERALTMPFVPPVSLVNRLTLGLFNRAYYRAGKRRAGPRVVHWQPFFYPLDHVRHWNRMYGPRGFFQYQCVVPPGLGRDAVRALLDEIGKSGEGSFLAVLKTFGERPAPGMLSFPQPGATLALDFPNRGNRTLRLFERLDAIVREAGGRLYPAKDARMPRSLFEAGYPQLGEFLRYRDPGISSGLSRRLMGN